MTHADPIFWKLPSRLRTLIIFTSLEARAQAEHNDVGRVALRKLELEIIRILWFAIYIQKTPISQVFLDSVELHSGLYVML